VTTLENALQQVEGGQLLYLHATLLLDLARAREQAGDKVGAAVEAKAAGAALATLDVVLAPADLALLERSRPGSSAPPVARTASLACEGNWWVASFAGASVRLPNSKGLRYLAELIGQPGTERHVLDLVEQVEGVAPAGGVDRRALGDAGPALDREARTAYRRRIEQLRAAANDAVTDGRFEAAEAMQGEIDQLVAELARAFGLGGRDRRAASAAERARLNVTRSLRAAIARLTEALPAASVLDQRVRTGIYCCYQPTPGDDVRWVVQS
jgi:hypothetical protein